MAWQTTALAVGLTLLGSAASATTTTNYHLLLQTRNDASAGSEVFLASYADLNTLRSSTLTAPTGFTQINVASTFQIRGMTWDGTAWRVLLQTRDDASAGSEVFLASYASLDALIASTLTAPTGFTQINVASTFQIAGFTWDGDAYRLLLQTRTDAGAGNEVFLASYTDLASLTASTLTAPTGFTQINIASTFEINDFTWDGSAYRLLLQTRADAPAGSEVFLASYVNLDALRASTLTAPTGFTQINVASTFRVAGLGSVTTITDPPPGGVPEPASWALLLAGFGATGVRLRFRRREGRAVATA